MFLETGRKKGGGADRFKGPSSVTFKSSKFEQVESKDRVCYTNEIMVVLPSSHSSGHSEASRKQCGSFLCKLFLFWKMHGKTANF